MSFLVMYVCIVVTINSGPDIVQLITYSTTRKSLNKCLNVWMRLEVASAHTWTQFALRSSAFICVRLCETVCVCVRLRTSAYVCVCLCASAYVCVRLLAFHRKV